MANTFELISAVTVGAGGASSISFTSIPGTYTDLVLKVSARTSRASNSDWLWVALNASSTGFTYREIEVSGATVITASGSGQYSIFADGNTATSNTFSNAEIYIPNYTNSSYKSFICDSVTENNATANSFSLMAQLWSNTAAISSISITSSTSSTIAQYSTAYLYGVKNA